MDLTSIEFFRIIAVMEDTITDQIQKYRDLEAKIRDIDNYELSKDLLKLARSCENYITEISKEQVNCRRLRHTTVKMQELADRLTECVNNLEQYILFAYLVKG